MIRISQFTMAAIFAAFLAVIGMAPAAQAASFPTGGTAQVEQLGKAQTEQAQYRRRGGYRGGYGYRRAYYRPRPVIVAPITARSIMAAAAGRARAWCGPPTVMCAATCVFAAKARA